MKSSEAVASNLPSLENEHSLTSKRWPSKFAMHLDGTLQLSSAIACRVFNNARVRPEPVLLLFLVGGLTSGTL